MRHFAKVIGSLPLGWVLVLIAISLTIKDSYFIQTTEQWMLLTVFGVMVTFFVIEIVRSFDIGKLAFAWDTTTSVSATVFAAYIGGKYGGAGNELLTFHYIVFIGLVLDSLVCPIIAFAMSLRNFGSVDGSSG